MTSGLPSDPPVSLPEEMLGELAALGLAAGEPPSLEQWQTLLLRLAHRFRSGSQNPLLQVSSALSHELRTPLTVVIGASELLLETELDPLQRQAAENVLTSAQELRGLFDRILSSVTEENPSVAPRSGSVPNLEIAAQVCPGRVLLAEDNEFNRVLIERALLTLHCDVEVAQTGREALHKLRATPFDLVIMDCHMPDIDGLEAARQIRAFEGEGRRVPIVAVTAGTVPGARQACREAGMDDFIAKPFSLNTLRRTVMRYLRRKAPQKPPAPEPQPQLQPAKRGGSGTHGRVLPESLDLSRLRDLADEAGSPSIVEELAGIFVKDMTERLESLRNAVNAEDKNQFLIILHAVKGASANFGAPRMAALAESAERHARRGELAALAQEVSELAVEFQVVKTELETELPKTRGTPQSGSRPGASQRRTG